jgi:hypothetical protein
VAYEATLCDLRCVARSCELDLLWLPWGPPLCALSDESFVCLCLAVGPLVYFDNQRMKRLTNHRKPSPSGSRGGPGSSGGPLPQQLPPRTPSESLALANASDSATMGSGQTHGNGSSLAQQRKQAMLELLNQVDLTKPIEQLYDENNSNGSTQSQ